MYRFCARRSIGRTMAGGTISQPMRQPGHREVFREAVDDHGLVGVGKRRLFAHAVGQPVIDFVGHQPDAVAPARGGNLGKARRLQHGAGWIGRACNDEAGNAGLAHRVVDVGARRHPARSIVRVQQHRILAERGQDVPVAGIAGRRQGHLGTGVEQRQEGQHEAGRRAGRDHHALRLDRDPIPVRIVPRDALAQRGQTQGQRVAERLALEGPARSRKGGARRRRAGLADLHVDDFVPQRFALGGGLHHVHDDERRARHCGAKPAGCATERAFGGVAVMDRPQPSRALKPPWLRPSRPQQPPETASRPRTAPRRCELAHRRNGAYSRPGSSCLGRAGLLVAGKVTTIAFEVLPARGS